MRSRRTVLSLAATSVIVGCQESATEPTRSGRDSATRTRAAATATGPADSDGASEDIVWRQSFGGAVREPVLTGDRLLVGTASGTLSSLAPADGGVQWTESLRVGPAVEVSTSGATVLVIGRPDEPNATDTLYALNVANGDPHWQFSPRTYWLDILAVEDGTVYVSTADDYLQSSGETLYAFDLDDGTEQWTTEVGESGDCLVTEDRLYIGSIGTVYAIGRDGTREWQYDLSSFHSPDLSRVGATIAIGSDGVVHGVEADSGEPMWRFDDFEASGTAAVGDRLLVDGPTAVASLDPATGEVLWQADVGWERADVRYTDTTVYVVRDEAVAVSVTDGSVEWRHPIADGFGSVVGRLGGQLLLQRTADAGPSLVALDADTGTPTWQYTGADELTRFAVGDSLVYTVDGDELVALDP